MGSSTSIKRGTEAAGDDMGVWLDGSNIKWQGATLTDSDGNEIGNEARPIRTFRGAEMRSASHFASKVTIDSAAISQVEIPDEALGISFRSWDDESAATLPSEKLVWFAQDEDPDPDADMFTFTTASNDVIRVTDDGGGPVDVSITTGAGSTITSGTAYRFDDVAAGLKAVLDGNATLSQTYTVTFDETTRKFTIAHGGATLSLHWSHANSTIEATIGFSDAADDTGATTYTADTAIVDPVGNIYYVGEGWRDIVLLEDTDRDLRFILESFGAEDFKMLCNWW